MTIDGTMPNVIGMQLTSAEQAINNASDGGSPTYTVENGGAGPSNQVKSTSPAAEEPITDSVTIVVYNPTP